jgi:hypothetical protein
MDCGLRNDLTGVLGFSNATAEVLEVPPADSLMLMLKVEYKLLSN